MAGAGGVAAGGGVVCAWHGTVSDTNSSAAEAAIASLMFWIPFNEGGGLIIGVKWGGAPGVFRHGNCKLLFICVCGGGASSIGDAPIALAHPGGLNDRPTKLNDWILVVRTNHAIKSS